MAKQRRQLAVSSASAGKPIGSLGELKSRLAAYNTAPDGAANSPGIERYYGPGIVLDVPSSTDPVMQAMVSIVEDDIAWPVLTRICRGLGWQMTDLESGRTFGS